MPSSGGTELWGKERVIASLVRAQRESGAVDPRVITFEECALADVLRRDGFNAKALAPRSRGHVSNFFALRRELSHAPPVLLHTHGYKANIFGRAARASRAPMRGLVATCHGWIDESRRTRFYNNVDRMTARASDVVTVPDERMLSRFPSGIRGEYVANGIYNRRPASAGERHEARDWLRLPQDRLLVGTLGRTDAAKGVRDVLEAARRSTGLPIQWVVAGSGPLEGEIRQCDLQNVTYVGYIEQSDRYLDALDVYLQASHTEGLSLSLLEAMRAALPIIATAVGSTEFAVRHMREALLVAAGDVAAIEAAARRFAGSAELRSQLGRAARVRFESAFEISYQHEAFLEIYCSCDRVRVPQ
jgi:glycosyltransferase involved in cell wall biosynthesis